MIFPFCCEYFFFLIKSSLHVNVPPIKPFFIFSSFLLQTLKGLYILLLSGPRTPLRTALIIGIEISSSFLKLIVS
jgi:hypothetical protein